MKRVLWGLGSIVYFGVTFAAPSCPSFPTPQSSRVVVVAQDMVVNGVPMSASELHSKQSPADVARFYRGEWESRSQRVLETMDGDWRTLATKDGQCFFTAQIKAGVGSGTYALLGTTQLITGTAKARGEGFPKLSGSTVYNDILSKDLGKTGRTLLMANKFSVDANASFYRNAMSGEGWVAVSDRRGKTEGGSRLVQIWRRGLEEANLVIGASADQTSVVVNIVDRP
jgi:hypothetical protein